MFIDYYYYYYKWDYSPSSWQAVVQQLANLKQIYMRFASLSVHVSLVHVRKCPIGHHCLCVCVRL